MRTDRCIKLSLIRQMYRLDCEDLQSFAYRIPFRIVCSSDCSDNRQRSTQVFITDIQPF